MSTVSPVRTPPTPQSVAPPFTLETALLKVRLAEDGWNSRDPARVALAYSEDSVWRNRSVFVTGRDQIRVPLGEMGTRTRLPACESGWWAFTDDHIAVRFSV